MKKKVCRWLDSNEMGGLLLNDNRVTSCCSSQAFDLIISEDLDFSKLTKEEIQNPRIALFESINDGTNVSCKGCPQLMEKEEDEIEIGPINFLPLGIFNTCNFRCQYCGFTDEQLGEKLKKHHTNILPIIKNLHKHGLLKQDFCLGLTGGEPTLMDDIPETLEFVAKNFKTPELTLFSNSSLTHRTEKLAPELNKLPKNLNKILLTSFDAGTPETYKKVRGQDLFYNTINNIINYAKHDSFDVYVLKYIFQLDHSNTSDEDIFGFLNVLKLISQNYSQKIRVVIDRDCGDKINECIDDEIIAAAGKIYYVVDSILKLPMAQLGSALTPNLPTGKKDLARIKEYAKKYGAMEKSMKEKYFLSLLSARNNIMTEGTSVINKSEENVKKFIETNKCKKICLYGAGSFAGQVLEKFDLSELNILGIIDKDVSKKGSKVGGYSVYSIDDIKTLNPDVIALTVLEKRYSLPSIEKLKTDKGYTFELIHDLFQS